MIDYQKINGINDENLTQEFSTYRPDLCPNDKSPLIKKDLKEHKIVRIENDILWCSINKTDEGNKILEIHDWIYQCPLCSFGRRMIKKDIFCQILH
jgi:hypothetical protein